MIFLGCIIYKLCFWSTKTNRFILKNIILFIFPIVFISSFFISSSYAQTEENYVVISGIDKSSGIAKDFTPSEIERLGVSDSELGSGIDRDGAISGQMLVYMTQRDI